MAMASLSIIASSCARPFFQAPPRPPQPRPSSPSPLFPPHPRTPPLTIARFSSSSRLGPSPTRETVFFDGGPHYGDLLANLAFGLSLLWLPLTLAAVFRALFLRYRFTNLRVTVCSGLTGADRKDFAYNVIQDVQLVPRFIGEWGDVVITLSDGTKVDLKCVPKFREIAKYCLEKAGKEEESKVDASAGTGPRGFS